MKNYIKPQVVAVNLILVFIINSGYTNGTIINKKNTELITVNDMQTQLVSKGEMLMAKNDCAGCHKPTVKIVGPSYIEIAKKYTIKDMNYLVGKIIKGGSGVFGKIPMTAHPNIKNEDAKEIVKYILSLK